MFPSMFRRKVIGAVGSLSTLSSVLYWKNFVALNAADEKVIETHGFPLRLTPSLSLRPLPTPLYLAGVGNISKVNHGLFKDKAEVLCRVGLALSPSAADRAKLWLSKKDTVRATLCDYLLSQENIITPYSISNPLKVAVVMRFNSGMRPDYLIHLIRGAFRSNTRDHNSSFFSALHTALGDTIEKDEEVAFYFFDNGDIGISKNGIIMAILNIPEVNHSLLDAFIHPTEAVVPELYDNTVRNIKNVRYF